MKIGWYEKLKHAVRYWLLRQLPPCKQTVKVLSESLERKLTLRERVLVKLHLWVCMWCVWYVEHLQLMRSSLRAETSQDHVLSSTAELSDDARERMKRRLTGVK